MSLAPESPAPRAALHRWPGLLVLGLTMTIATAEIGVVSAIFPVLRETFGLTIAHLGIFAGIGLLARTIFGPVWGLLADRYGRKRVLVAAMLSWSLCVAATGMVNSYLPFLALYSLGVIGAVAAEPIANSLLSDLFPASERGKAFGVLRALVGLGVAVRIPFAGWLAAFPAGSNWIFFMLGALQVITGLLLVIGLKEPRPGESEAGRLSGGAPARFNFRDVPTLWRIPSIRLFALNYMLATSLVMVYFMPTFLTELRGYSVQTSTQMCGLFHVGAVIGSLLGGLLGDWVARSNPRFGRIVLMQVYLGMFAGLSLLVFIVHWQSPVFACVVMFIFGLVYPVGFSGCVLPMLSTVILPEMRSTGFGLLSSFCQGLSLTVVSTAVGVGADRFGLSCMLFWAVTVPYFTNAGIWFMFYRHYPRDVAAMQQALEARATGSNA